jgi:hypothetical protein
MHNKWRKLVTRVLSHNNVVHFCTTTSPSTTITEQVNTLRTLLFPTFSLLLGLSKPSYSTTTTMHLTTPTALLAAFLFATPISASVLSTPHELADTIAPDAAGASTAPWEIDPQCLPGVVQCHSFNDRFRYCNLTGFWVPNYCGGDWVCCVKSYRMGLGPMCESPEQCEILESPGMATLW